MFDDPPSNCHPPRLRRDLVTDIGRTAKRRAKGNLIKLIAIQQLIDALDKAYEDEKADMVERVADEGE